MRLIPGPVQLPYPPRACAVTNRADGDFIDFNVVIDRPEPTRLYMKTEVVEEAARLCGMVPAKEVEGLREQMAALSKELDDVTDTLKIAADFEDKLGRERIAA